MSLGAEPNPDHDLLAGWSHLVDGVLHDLLPVGTRVALVNFPNHANAGDSAIWLGALASLRRMQVAVAYRASWGTYEPQALRRALGDGVVLLQGGGNFGDLYPANQQATRERVLEELADLRTIQLPQSLHFDDPANLERMRRLTESHSDFTLLVREEASLAHAKEHFDVPIELCPDLALALDSHRRVRDPRVDVLHLARTDKESTGTEVVDPEGVSVERVDWLADLDDEPKWPAADRWRLRLNRALLKRSQASPWFARNTWKDSAMTYEALGRRWVARADEILARGRVVRTDRLHAHVLSLLQGIPHVIEDNSTGKVKAFHDTWTNACSLTHWASSPAEAAELARGLVENR
jgi:pyruvyl transferase EpsO